MGYYPKLLCTVFVKERKSSKCRTGLDLVGEAKFYVLEFSIG